ncbi:DUF4411 family protein [Xenorhabdus budapestensis]|uniref:DUF4411 family protein n=1 Tax=Xenorhabdus budapestensis TaxID=290110 RepID=A0ABX7VKA7_XENBU|nr:DUF4411 family protein [Xenorhabdus budapestensis]QTL41113.1 DUF4411 family protein [Xenorhabdus budapestensis]
MIYLIDYNIFIQAQQDYYCFDLCPGFWDLMESKFAEGQVVSIKSVYHELQKQDDDVYSWIKNKKSFFQSIDDELTQKTFTEIVNYVYTEYSPRHRNSLPHIEKFLGAADPWIVAKAKSINATVVTHEVRDKNNGCRPKIPDICDHFEVPIIRTKEMLRNFQIKFILSQSSN